MKFFFRNIFIIINVICNCFEYEVDGQIARSRPEEGNFILSLIRFLRSGQMELNRESLDDKKILHKMYDFIIVGAGTAGCTLAARLSENPNWQVLLLEAGGPETLIMDVPVFAHFLQLSPEITWKYRTQPSSKFCLGLEDNRCNWPRGKVMGGSSAINYMMYTRGNRRDYDRWSDLGNKGWSYKEVLPYFKKYEGSLVSDAEADYVGRRGPLKVTYATLRSRIGQAFINASQEEGLQYRDYNGQIQTGVSYLQTTIYNGERFSANRAYLYPLKGKRPNLHIQKHALVTKVLIDEVNMTAYGVLFECLGKTYRILAKREVILSAGAINTPQLLLLSGIGPSKQLRRFGITPLMDLAVGFNLQDHISTLLTVTTSSRSLHLTDFFNTDNIMQYIRTRSGLFSSPSGIEGLSFWDLENPTLEDGWPDIEHFIISGGLNTNPAVLKGLGVKSKIYHYLYKDIIKNDLHHFLLFAMILRPKSRGRIMLQSQNPHDHPLIYANYLDDPYDLDILMKGVRKLLNLIEQPSFRKINATLLNRQIPSCRKYGDVTSKAYLECYIRHFTFTIYHYSGTAKMGPSTDRTAVVDERLKVYGIRQLRVVDASIMPELIAAHPNGPVFMIAEKAADMIKEDHGFL